MHLLFLHQNYPAQFGHIAHYLAKEHGHQCTFVTQATQVPAHEGVTRITYKPAGGATAQTHFCSRTFENVTWHSQAIFDALAAHPLVKPDLVVAHAGFFSSVFLRELYNCPILNYFEHFYHTTNSEMDFRPEFGGGLPEKLRARNRNAALLLDLHNCDAGYSPTHYQRGRLPAEYQPKIRVVFDGVDTVIWKPQPGLPRKIGGIHVPPGTKLVTYVARGMESMRGFDRFMQFSAKLCKQRADVLFVVVGQDRVCYGGDEKVTQGKTFKDWVLAQQPYDLSRYLFTGLLPMQELAQLLALTDLHCYFTVPFVLSWSLINALACGAPVLASDTAPVQEVIRHQENGLLADFFDDEAWLAQANELLDNPTKARQLGDSGVDCVQQKYALKVCLPQLHQLYQETASLKRPG